MAGPIPEPRRPLKDAEQGMSMQPDQLEKAWGMWQIADEGWPVLAAAGLLTILLTLIYPPLGTFALGLMVWLSHILRVPARIPPADKAAVLAPADGRVIDIAASPFPGSLHDAGPDALRISIRTALSDAQLQRVPIDGQVIDNFAIPGLFLPYDDMTVARADNERREIVLRHHSGGEIMVVQVGGPIARQLVCRLNAGRQVARGAPLGMARIGGVVDLFVPVTCAPRVFVGQHVFAGESVVAVWPQILGKQTPNKLTPENV